MSGGQIALVVFLLIVSTPFVAVTIINNLIKESRIAKSLARHLIRHAGKDGARATLDESIKDIGMRDYVYQGDLAKLKILFAAVKLLDSAAKEIEQEKESLLSNEVKRKAEKEIERFCRKHKL